MRVAEFRVLLDSVPDLTPFQRESLLRALEAGDGDLVRELLEELMVDGVSCPHCKATRVIRWGQASGLPRWRCKACGRTFNPLTGSALSGLHYRNRWPEYAESLRRGETLKVAAERCGVHINTAYRWRHRFLRESAHSRAHLVGIAEADETLVLRSFKGQQKRRSKSGRAARARGGKAEKRGRSKESVSIFVARDRGGATIDKVLESVTVAGVRTVMQKAIEPDTVLCTDGLNVYRLLAAELNLQHEALRAHWKERVRGPFHIQNVNNYHSRWKGWMRRFNGVATHYLPNYLGWFRTLDGAPDARSGEFMLHAALAA
jgi:transposase-like protein